MKEKINLHQDLIGALYIVAGKCPAGEYPVNNADCALCPFGYYKPTVDNVACTACGASQTTARTGSTASADCGQYDASCLPNTQLILWSVWCSLCAQYTTHIVVSMMLPVCPVHSSYLSLVWCFPDVQYTALIVVNMFPVCPMHSSGCSHYVSCFVISVMFPVCPVHSSDCGQCSLAMPSTQLWLWSVWCSLYAQYTALTVVSAEFHVCPIHSSDCGQCSLAMPWT